MRLCWARQARLWPCLSQKGDPQIAEEFMPIIYLVFSNLKTWLLDEHLLKTVSEGNRGLVGSNSTDRPHDGSAKARIFNLKNAVFA